MVSFFCSWNFQNHKDFDWENSSNNWSIFQMTRIKLHHTNHVSTIALKCFEFEQKSQCAFDAECAQDSLLYRRKNRNYSMMASIQVIVCSTRSWWLHNVLGYMRHIRTAIYWAFQCDSCRESKTAQLTILYSGRVLVLDNFPAHKAKDLMQLASRETSRIRQRQWPKLQIVLLACPIKILNWWLLPWVIR